MGWTVIPPRQRNSTRAVLTNGEPSLRCDRFIKERPRVGRPGPQGYVSCVAAPGGVPRGKAIAVAVMGQCERSGQANEKRPQLGSWGLNAVLRVRPNLKRKATREPYPDRGCGAMPPVFRGNSHRDGRRSQLFSKIDRRRFEPRAVIRGIAACGDFPMHQDPVVTMNLRIREARRVYYAADDACDWSAAELLGAELTKLECAERITAPTSDAGAVQKLLMALRTLDWVSQTQAGFYGVRCAGWRPTPNGTG